MLADYMPVPALAVRDLAKAREFYEETLGFRSTDEVPDGVMYAAGGGMFLVYPSAYAGTNKATAMSFLIAAGLFDAEVSSLRDKGISFQTFENENLTWDAGVATMGALRAVWFADPDGNILNLETIPA